MSSVCVCKVTVSWKIIFVEKHPAVSKFCPFARCVKGGGFMFIVDIPLNVIVAKAMTTKGPYINHMLNSKAISVSEYLDDNENSKLQYLF